MWSKNPLTITKGFILFGLCSGDFIRTALNLGKEDKTSTQPSSWCVLSKLLMSKPFHQPVKDRTWETAKNAMCILNIKLAFENKIQEIGVKLNQIKSNISELQSL